MTTADVSKHKALKIDPQEYIRCSELRKKVCPVFAEVQIDKEQVQTQWPERAVPAAILQGAQGMDTLHTFKPTLDGPATMKAPTCNLPSNDQDPRVIDDDNAADTKHSHCEDDADATENDADVAAAHADESASPLELPAEFLIGVEVEDTNDPVDLMVVFQKT